MLGPFLRLKKIKTWYNRLNLKYYFDIGKQFK